MAFEEELKSQLKTLHDFIWGQSRLNSNQSTPVKRRLTSILIVILLDLDRALLLIEGSIKSNSGNEELAFHEYISHIKRSCILDIWALLEHQIRVTSIQLKIEVKSNSKRALEYINEAENFLNLADESFKKCLNSLNEAKKYLNDDFIEFPKIRDALFAKMFDNIELQHWKSFFEILSNIRNASHSGFVAHESKKFCGGFMEKSFTQGKGIEIELSEIQEIIKHSGTFLNKLEIFIG